MKPMELGSALVVDRSLSDSLFSLPELLKSLRVKRGMTARELSLKAGLSQSYVSKVESGSLSPTLDAFARIVQQLGCSDLEILFIVKSFFVKG